MRLCLARFELLSWGPTMQLDKTGHSRDYGHCPPGESEPPHLYLRQRYDLAATDEERLAVVFEARSLYRDLTQRKVIVVHEESPAEFLIRVLGAKGWPPKDVAIALRCSASQVRRLRTENGCDPDTGEICELDAKALRIQGMSWREIARLVGKPQSTIRYQLRSKT